MSSCVSLSWFFYLSHLLCFCFKHSASVLFLAVISFASKRITECVWNAHELHVLSVSVLIRWCTNTAPSLNRAFVCRRLMCIKLYTVFNVHSRRTLCICAFCWHFLFVSYSAFQIHCLVSFILHLFCSLFISVFSFFISAFSIWISIPTWWNIERIHIDNYFFYSAIGSINKCIWNWFCLRIKVPIELDDWKWYPLLRMH